MSKPAAIDMPCASDAYVARRPRRIVIDCDECFNYEPYGGKCLGPEGWAFMAVAAAEVARERALHIRRLEGKLCSREGAYDLILQHADDLKKQLKRAQERGDNAQR